MLSTVLDGAIDDLAEVRQISDAWRQRGQALAVNGSFSYDQCIELVLRNCPEPMRAAELTSWGIANAVVQLQAYDYVFNLPSDDPLRTLSNSQKIEIFSAPEKWLTQLLGKAREIQGESRTSGMITRNWVQHQVALLERHAQDAQRNARLQTGYVPSATERLVKAIERSDEWEARSRKLEAEVNQLQQLVMALQAHIEELEVA